MLTSMMPVHSYYHPDTVSDDGDSDTESDYTEMSLDSGIASTMTSADVSMRSASPTPSVFSFTSSLRAQAYRQEYGRGLNNYSDVYRLPADDEELERLGPSGYPFFSFFPSSMSKKNSMKCSAKLWESTRPLCRKL